jgi:cytochrome c oxidase assembly protein subunit 15
MDFGNAFQCCASSDRRRRASCSRGEVLTAIHWMHRMFALVVVAVVGWTTIRTFAVSPPLGAAIGALLVIQFPLGIANVAFGLPLALAAAHNAGAALLVAALVVLNFSVFRAALLADHYV